MPVSQRTKEVCAHYNAQINIYMYVCMYVYLFAVKTGTSMQWDQI